MIAKLAELNLTPYLIVSAFAFALLILLYLRRRLVIQQSAVPSMLIGNGQTIGTREEQDDSFSTVATRYGTIAVLADGISGLENGRMASTVAVTTFIREFLKLDDLQVLPAFFAKAAKLSNSEILRNLKGARGGTTLVAAVIADDYLYWGAVGDSSISIFRDGQFITINEKHTLETVLQDRYLRHEITKEEVLDNPMGKRLVNYLGYDRFKNMEIYSDPIPLHPGDKVVLCSDGVYNTLSEVDLENILSQPISPYDAAQEIIQAVEEKGLHNQDNATVVIMEQGY
ncbi:serine/threonine-protein phosphatase [Paenibacillus sp. 481]|nr:serine/threonine-protein phosphatase [Paenibacillus sp. 481]